MYISKVIIENFQSHELTEFELSRGLTVLVGESDRGKSAVIRALRWLFENEPRGTGFIRSGASTARVTVIMEDGTRITRERTSSKNRYVVQRPGGREEVFEKFGAEVPAEISALHGVAKVKLDEDLHVSLNLSLQLDGPFLLSSPGSLKAKAIGRLHSVHLIDAAARDVQQEMLSLRKKDDELAGYIAELDESLKEYADLPEMERCLEKCRQLVERLEVKNENLSRLFTLRAELSRVRVNLNSVKTALKKLSKLDNLRGELTSAENKIHCWKNSLELRRRLHTVRENLNRAVRISKKTRGIPGGLGLMRKLEGFSGQYRELSGVNQQLRAIRREKYSLENVLQRVSGAPRGIYHWQRAKDLCEKRDTMVKLAASLTGIRESLNSCRQMLQAVGNVEEGAGRLSSLNEKMALVSQLLPLRQRLYRLLEDMARIGELLKRTDKVPGAVEEVETLTRMSQTLALLKDYRVRLMDTRKRIRMGREYLGEREKELEELVFQYGSLLKSLGRCPTCFNVVDRETLEKIVLQLKKRSG